MYNQPLPLLPKLLELKLSKNYNIEYNILQFPSLIKLIVDDTEYNIKK